MNIFHIEKDIKENENGKFIEDEKSAIGMRKEERNNEIENDIVLKYEKNQNENALMIFFK